MSVSLLGHRSVRRVAGAVGTVAATGLLLAGCGTGGSTAAPAVTDTVTATPPAVTATPAVTTTATVTAPPSTTGTSTTVPTATPTTSTPTASTPSAGTALRPCPTSALTVTIGGGSGGAAGSVYTDVQFRLTGSSACTLNGHPGVSYVTGPHGTQVGRAATRTGTPTTVVLVPGAHAHAELRMVQYQDIPAGTCRPAAVGGIRVYPPDQTTAVVVPVSGKTCGSTAGAAQVLSVGPVQPGPAPTP